MRKCQKASDILQKTPDIPNCEQETGQDAVVLPKGNKYMRRVLNQAPHAAVAPQRLS